MLPEIFGTLEKGTPDNPAVVMKGVHYFYKYVSGNVLEAAALVYGCDARREWDC